MSSLLFSLCLCEDSRNGSRRESSVGVWLRSTGGGPAGGGGNFANSLDGPVNSTSLLESRELLALMRGGRADDCVGVAGDAGARSAFGDVVEDWRISGSVPDRFRVSACREVAGVAGEDMNGVSRS